jgi:hypothetical protein
MMHTCLLKDSEFPMELYEVIVSEIPVSADNIMVGQYDIQTYQKN